MGNMSNPLINRWGLNIFWYNLWFTDYNFKTFYNQDKIFSQLVYLYLFYGLKLPYNIFANKYWYSFNLYSIRFLPYSKWITRRGSQFGELVRYSLRVETECLFPMKLWILKYSNWVILNQYWFYPLKIKLSLSNKFNLNNMPHADSFNLIKNNKSFKINKIKALMTTNFIRAFLSNYYYRF